MPRDISRNRDSLGSSKKTSPKVQDSAVQKALDAVYRELNELKQSVNKEAIGSQARPSEGKSGDMRLYSKKGLDGTVSHYIQAKFGEFWASGRLGVDEIDPELRDVVQSVVPDLDIGDGEYITKLGVTFENLDSNGDIGLLSTQVPKGDHTHSHTTLTDIGTKLHSEIDSHIDDATIHFTVVGISTTTATVSNTATAGNASTAAPTDHVHKLDTEVPYTWLRTQTFNPISGNAITTGGNVHIGGDATITGDLTVDYAETGDENGNATIGNDLTVDGDTELKENVELNSNVGVGNNYTDTYSTTVRGKVNAYNEVSIEHQLSGSDSQLSIKHDNTNKMELGVSDTGFATIKVSGTDGPNSLQLDAVSLRPKDNLTSDLGHIDKKWKTIFAGELFVETLVAQDVMATTGGRIMVAPTSKLNTAITGTSSGIIVEHNIFENGDIGFMQSAPNGFAQTEAIRFTSAPVPTSVVDPMAATNANQNAIDYFVGAGITKLISFPGPHGCEHGQYITINHDTTLDTDQWTGPTSTTNVYQVYIETDSSKLPTYFNTVNTLYLALPAAAQQSPGASEISITRAPYTYTIQRNVNNDSGANAWPKDTAIVNWGKDAGDGYIDITATQGVYAQLGPHISLKARKNNTAGVNNDWLVPEIARLGNLDGTGYTGTRSFGLMVGENIENSPTATLSPFKGIQASDEGVKLYNSGLETYTGSSKTVYLGEDLRTGIDFAGKSAFILGEGIGVNGANQYENASLAYAWNVAQGKYVLKLDGAIDIVSDNFYDSPEDVFNSLPNFSMSENPSSSGLYLTPHYLGFYSGSNWPVVIGSSGTNNGDLTEDNGIEAFARIGIEGDTKGYLKYTPTDGLEVSGKITVTNPSNYAILYNQNFSFSLSATVNTCIKPIGANYETGIHYVHILAYDAEEPTGAVPYFSTNHNAENDLPGTNATWNLLGAAMQGANEQYKWYSYAMDLTSIGNQNSIKIVGNNNDGVVIQSIIITTGHPGDPQAIREGTLANELAGNHSETIYQETQPSGSNYNTGDQWVNTSNGNELWIWNGSGWEASFTQIDGGSITTGTIAGVSLQSTQTFAYNGGTLPRTKMDLGSNNSLIQYAAGTNPVQYTKLDGGTLTYVHQSQDGGVANDPNPISYPLPTAQQIINANDINLGSTFSFAPNYKYMYTDDYEVIPIPKIVTTTGQQSIQDLNSTNGIAREEIEYSVTNKTKQGFKMQAIIRRGTSVSTDNPDSFSSSDLVNNVEGDSFMNEPTNTTNQYWDQSEGLTPGASYANIFTTQTHSDNNQKFWAKGLTNSNCVGGANRFIIKWNTVYRSIVYYQPGDGSGGPGDLASWPGYPGLTRWMWCVKVSSMTNAGHHGSDMIVWGPPGSGAPYTHASLLASAYNEGTPGFSTEDPDSTWPSGNARSNYGSYDIELSFGTPNDAMIVNPLVEVICYCTHRETNGTDPSTGLAFESPRNTPLNENDSSSTLTYVKMGQVPEEVESVQGTGKVGALVWTAATN